MTASLFDLVKAFDTLLGSSTNQFDSSPTFVANIFTSVLYQVRREEQLRTELRTQRVILPQEEPQVLKQKLKSPPPATKNPQPRKQKQPKNQPKIQAQTGQPDQTSTKQWSNLLLADLPPSYSICRNQTAVNALHQ